MTACSPHGSGLILPYHTDSRRSAVIPPPARIPAPPTLGGVMATLDVSCPNCDKRMKVPDTAAGKKIRCKGCEHVFAVPAAGPKGLPDEFRKAPPAKAKSKPAKAAPPPPAEAEPAIKFLDDEPKPKHDPDDDSDETPFSVIKEGEVPRCPHCAYELDPPDTRVCMNCGYDMVQRRRLESKKVFEHTQADYLQHWLPGIIWLIVMIAMITVAVICFLRMDGWLAGSFLEKDDKNAITGKTEFYVGAGCFTMVVTLVTFFLCLIGVRVVYKKLIKNWRPPEIEKKK